MSYASLHLHTEYSNVSAGLDSVNKLKNVIQYARDVNLSGCFVTNHDNLSEIWQINEAQKQLRKEESSFKVGFGNEIYLMPQWDPEDTSPKRYYHFLLLAKDKIGYDALIELSTRAWYRSKVLRGKRRIVISQT